LGASISIPPDRMITVPIFKIKAHRIIHVTTDGRGYAMRIAGVAIVLVLGPFLSICWLHNKRPLKKRCPDIIGDGGLGVD